MFTGQSFLNFLITKTSSEQFGTLPFAKIFWCFDIFTWSPTLNIGSSLFFYLLKSKYMLEFTPTGFVLTLFRMGGGGGGEDKKPHPLPVFTL